MPVTDKSPDVVTDAAFRPFVTLTVPTVSVPAVLTLPATSNPVTAAAFDVRLPPVDKLPPLMALEATIVVAVSGPVLMLAAVKAALITAFKFALIAPETVRSPAVSKLVTRALFAVRAPLTRALPAALNPLTVIDVPVMPPETDNPAADTTPLNVGGPMVTDPATLSVPTDMKFAIAAESAVTPALALSPVAVTAVATPMLLAATAPANEAPPAVTTPEELTLLPVILAALTLPVTTTDAAVTADAVENEPACATPDTDRVFATRVPLIVAVAPEIAPVAEIDVADTAPVTTVLPKFAVAADNDAVAVSCPANRLVPVAAPVDSDADVSAPATRPCQA